jgi:hypothetical protein
MNSNSEEYKKSLNEASKLLKILLCNLEAHVL